MTIVFKQLSDNEHNIALKQHRELWGSTLTLDEYKQREIFCRQFQKIIPFGLVTDGGELVASLEAYVRKAFVNNKIEEIYSVASVFVPVEHRKNVYATKLFLEFCSMLDASNMKSILFSDIGYFYKKFDYRAEPGQACVLNAKHSEFPFSFLKLGDLSTISSYNSSHTNFSDFSVIADVDAYSFAYCRELYYRAIDQAPCTIDELNATWNKLILNTTLSPPLTSKYNYSLPSFESSATPLHIDFKVGCFIQKNNGSYGYILWTALIHKQSFTNDLDIQNIQDYKHLNILTLEISAPTDELRKELENELLEAAQHYAYLQKLDKVVLWSFDYPHLKNTTLNDGWPAIRPSNVKWKNILRYCWC